MTMTHKTRIEALERRQGPTGYSYVSQDLATGLWSVGPNGPRGLTEAELDRLALGNVKGYRGVSPDDWDTPDNRAVTL